ncbi:pyrroline-5-carboxylate reductase [Neobacillus sp. SM06]|uniref:pyrroline-5-carboxylate reductase n=1 Tax=Neobacillus sp. SM06 TaxID=3422492 RepID=UPI003D27E40E
MKKLVFIGAGSMAEALISGIVENQLVDGKDIWVTNQQNEKKLALLQTQYGIHYTYDLRLLFQGADAVILAMKPKDAATAVSKIKDYLTKDVLLISVLAGVSIETIETLADQQLAIARAMPNTSAAVGKSATAIAVNQRVTEQQSRIISELFATVGMTAFVAEDDLDAVTGLSGSGPAYIYYLVEAMENSAAEIGLERAMAKELIVQTLIGAAEMLKTSEKSPSQLRKEVTSPGGTTEAGIQILQENGVQEAFIACIKAAAARSRKMGEELTERFQLS